MKNRITRLFSIIFASLFIITTSNLTVYASEFTNTKSIETPDSDILVKSFTNDTAMYNVVVYAEKMAGEFSITYKNNPNYVYEFQFVIPAELTPQDSDTFWRTIVDICLTSKSCWSEIYIPNAIAIIDYNSEHPSSLSNRSNPDTSVLINHMRNKYGAPYQDQFVTSRTTNGTTLILKSGLLYRANISTSYVILQTMTISSFITSFMGLPLTPKRILMTSLAFGGAEILTAGMTVDEYVMTANWIRYVTVNNGTYVYNLADRNIYEKALYSRSNENQGQNPWNIDEEYWVEEYAPSYTYYYSDTNLLDGAYQEYLRLGYMG